MPRKHQQSEINFRETKKKSQSFRSAKPTIDKENDNQVKLDYGHSVDDMSLPTPVRRSSRKNPTVNRRIGSPKALAVVSEKENPSGDSDESDIQIIDEAPLKTPRSKRKVSSGKLNKKVVSGFLENDENKENFIDLTETDEDVVNTESKSRTQKLPVFTIKSSLKCRNVKAPIQSKQDDAVLGTKTSSVLNLVENGVEERNRIYSNTNRVENLPVLPLTPPDEPVPVTASVKFASPLKITSGENGHKPPIVQVTPQNQKSLRRSIVESNSLTCSAVGRKRRILFPGYEYYQEMKSAFCPKQQVLSDDYTNLDNNMLAFDGKASGKRTIEAKEIIPGREEEIDRLQSLVNQVVLERQNASLYISGPPGTGKSACVTAVLQELLSKRGKDVAVVKIVNCVRCRTQQSIIEVLGCDADGVFADKKMGSSKGQRPFIVVLDEVDQVEANHHSFIYKMFEWVHEWNSRTFLLIAIANALDLTERVLPRLALSSVKPQLMHYKPYSGPQIVKIIQDRISKVNNGMGLSSGIPGVSNSTSQPLLDRGAIELCARKVASSTGDARKALELCRKAIETVQREAMNQYNAIQALDTPPHSPRLDQENRHPSGIQGNSTPGNVTSRVTISVMNKVISDSLTSWASSKSNSLGSMTSSVNSGIGGYSINNSGSSQDSCPLHHKVIITSLARLTKQSSAAYFNMHQVLAKYALVCNEKAIATLDQSQLHMVMNLLEARGLLQLTAPGNRKLGTCDLRNMKVHVKGNLFELLSSNELDV